MKKKLLQYGITTAVGLLIAALVLKAEDISLLWSDVPSRYSVLCDAAFVPGVLLTLIGALVWIASTGFFDGLAYGFRCVAHLFVPFVKGKAKNYYDFKTERAEKRGEFSAAFLPITGLAFLAVAVIFLVLFGTAS